MQAPSVLPSLVETIEEIRRENGDEVAIEEVADVVASLMTSIKGDLSAADLRVHQELDELVQFVRRARAEIAAIRPESIRDDQIATATNELGAVVQATEAATDTFLDVAEKMETIADGVGGETGESLYELSTRIFEASNFQDITGQRITKVMDALSHIESKAEHLARIINGDDIPVETSSEVAADETAAAKDDLLHGPSLPEEANSQAEIDALLASFD
ncbi:MAG: protein phosphatase CheZ [Alphaproteobacteria bacterium]|jgi:chemotaxis protein CheZ|nr:protein phosphatase CheZ [Alphaproteobacteria bacterium]MDP6563730.1 protein phosphatase CheZ [Alphaproteobacteria bacterium]MDP6815751.1 protein phosphatase CheZ [Alphaproteobacteria bacterium]